MFRNTKIDLYSIIIGILSIILISQLIPITKNFATSVYNNRAANITDWGLGYGESGEQPRGNADKEYLKQFESYYVGDDDEKIIYLTFDAGYENGYTNKLLDVLKENKVPAAFFLVSNYVRDNPDLVKRMDKEGHFVCNHTTTHPDMSKISSMDDFRKELEGIETVYRDLIGKDMNKYYRPPQGKFSESNLKNAKDLGYTTIFWSLAYVDWYDDKQPTKEHAFSKLLPRMHPGAIVLLHSNSKTNSEILDEFIKKMISEGYSFKSLDYLSAQ